MKLSAAQLKRVQEQISGKSVPDDNPLIPELQETFGDHTYFLDEQGLNIVEKDPAKGSQNCKVVKLASWSEDHSSLVVHEPEIRTVEVELGSDDGKSA